MKDYKLDKREVAKAVDLVEQAETALLKYCHHDNCRNFNSCPSVCCTDLLGLDTSIAWEAASTLLTTRLMTKSLLTKTAAFPYKALSIINKASLTELDTIISRHFVSYGTLLDLLEKASKALSRLQIIMLLSLKDKLNKEEHAAVFRTIRRR